MQQDKHLYLFNFKIVMDKGIILLLGHVSVYYRKLGSVAHT